MSNILQIKRGTKATIPTLAAGEPGFCIDTFEFFIGTAASGNKQIGGMANPMTTQGDIIYGGASGAPTRLAIGTARKVLAVNSGVTAPEWVASLQSLITEQGDIIYGSAANTPAALAHGTSGQFLKTQGHGANPTWADVPASSTAGNYCVGFSDVHDVTEAVYTKHIEFYIGRAGAIRVRLGVATKGGNTAYARVYKNGVAVGTERSTLSTTLVFYDEDFTALVAGDLIQIYGKQTNAGCIVWGGFGVTNPVEANFTTLTDISTLINNIYVHPIV